MERLRAGGRSEDSERDERGRLGAAKSNTAFLVWIVAALALASGILDLFTLVAHRPHPRAAMLASYSPFEFHHLSRFVLLLIGFSLAVSSVQLFRRKHRAFQVVAALSGVSIVVHLVRGPDLLHAGLAAAVLALLLATRRSYTVGSGLPRVQTVLPALSLGFVLAVGYGAAGFWLLEKHHFGVNFTFAASVRETLRYLFLLNDPSLVPQSRHALWFLDSLNVMTTVLLATVVISLFRPAYYTFRTHPREIHHAREIIEKHGRSSLDYFKAWPDKSYFFSPSGRSCIAYGVAQSFAIALADPVGPDEEIPALLRGFMAYCRANDWGMAFHQTLPDYLPFYRELGLKKLKIGDNAVVDLPSFTLEGKDKKNLRHKLSQLDKILTTRLWDPPVPEQLLHRAREVSDAWLEIPGRRERGFTLGSFDPAYLRTTPVFSAEDEHGRLLAFSNLIPSPVPGETTIDLMRYRPDSPNGIMDFLFLKLFQIAQERGFTRFDLGMAPMAGFEEREEPTPEERAVHLFFQHLNFLFSFQGLRHYKAKFATSWEPRYVVYRSTLDLPRIALALNALSTIHEHGRVARKAIELREALGPADEHPARTA